MKRDNITQLLILIGCNMIIFFFLVFLGRFLATIFVYYKSGYFSFDWKETFLLSLKKGVVIGLVLGLGLWIKARLKKSKDSEKTNQ